MNGRKSFRRSDFVIQMMKKEAFISEENEIRLGKN